MRFVIRSLVLPTCLSALSLGCFVVDDGHLRDVTNQNDMGSDMPDMPMGLRPADQCDDDAAILANAIGATTTGIVIDTTQGSFTNDKSIDCDAIAGRTMSPGRDAFIGLQVGAGELWHFHLRYTGPETDRNPILYVLDPMCNERACSAGSVGNACTTVSDEHFAFEFPSSGLWRIAVDDGNSSGGGTYQLNIFRLECGDSIEMHGEGCDASDPSSTALCTSTCQRSLPSSPIAEREPNDTLPEASQLALLTGATPAGSQIVTGGIGGMTDCYPDFYTFTTTETRNLRVRAEDMLGNCVEAPFSITLIDTAGTRTPGVSLPCSMLEVPSLPEGEYYIEVLGTATPTAYRLHAEFL